MGLEDTLCIVVYSLGIAFNALNIMSVKSPRRALNATDFVMALNALQYIAVFATLCILDTCVWRKENDEITNEICSVIGEMLLDTLPISALVLALVRLRVFSAIGNGTSKVKRFSVTVLYCGCLLFVLICTYIPHAPALHNATYSIQLHSNQSDVMFHQECFLVQCLKNFVVHETSLIITGGIYIYIFFKTRNSSLRINAQNQLRTPGRQQHTQLKAVGRLVLICFCILIFMWIPYDIIKLSFRKDTRDDMAGAVLLCLKSLILFSHPIEDGMFLKSRRKNLVQNIRSILRIQPALGITDEPISTVVESMTAINSSLPKQSPLISREREIAIEETVLKTPVRTFLTFTPPSEDFQLSPLRHADTSNPIICHAESSRFRTSVMRCSSKSGESILENVSFHSSSVSIDFGRTSITPASVQSLTFEKKISVIKLKHDDDRHVSYIGHPSDQPKYQ